MKFFFLLIITLIVVICFAILNVIRKHILFLIRLYRFLKKTDAKLLTSKPFWWIASVQDASPNFHLVYSNQIFAVKIIADSFFPIHNTIVFLNNLTYTMTRRFLDRKSIYTLDFRKPDKYPYDLSATCWHKNISIEHYGKQVHFVALFFPAKKQIYMLNNSKICRIHDGATINNILFCGTTSLFSAIRSSL